MQVNDQVKVTQGAFTGNAGLVVAVSGDDVTVKLDLFDKPEIFGAADLQFLGR